LTIKISDLILKGIKAGLQELLTLIYKELDLFQLDVSGECEVSYTKSGSSITKNKQKCQNLEIAGQFINPNKV
jgi:hypothetical protein